MMSDFAGLPKSTQEQAVAAWLAHLNQLRVDALLEALNRQELNLESALATLDAAIKTIDLDIVALNRGQDWGIHGFIAEVAEVGVGNARSELLGEGRVYEWVNNNGAADLLRNGVEIQQKFYMKEGHFGLRAVANHLKMYPGFTEGGGKYQIPKDHYETVRKLHAMPLEGAGKSLSRSGDGPSFTDWKRVQAFFADGSVSIDSLEPSHLEYAEVQRGTYHSTLDTEKESLRSTDESLRRDAYQESRPSLQESAKAVGAAAVIEGGTALVLAVMEKRREGKKLKEFTAEDWRGVAGDAGLGAVTGGVRGLSIYALTNYTATPAAVASSMVTAAFGIAEQANRFRTGEISELEFIENAEAVSLATAISALSSFVGQATIPVPVLGAVIGNSVGTIVYKNVRTYLSDREAELIEQHLAEQQELDESLAAEHQELLQHLNATLDSYLDVLGRAFSPDVRVAFAGSIELARQVGVAPENVLDTEAKIAAYFLD